VLNHFLVFGSMKDTSKFEKKREINAWFTIIRGIS
jgi:hypothetical protein